MSTSCKVYAVAMCYNEVDIIEDFVVKIYNEEFDGLILLDHFSDDGTREKLEEMRLKLSSGDFDFQVLYTKERAFNKARKINGLAAYANFSAWQGRNGRTWIVPMDIDERWETDGATALANALKQKISLSHSFYNHMHNYVITPNSYRDYYLKPNDSRQQIRNEKCCFVWSPDVWTTSGFHNLFIKGRQAKVQRASWLVIKHYPYRSYQQVRDKYENLQKAIMLQPHRNPQADRHSVERGSMNEKEFAEFFNLNCFSSHPEEDAGLIKEA